MNYKAACDKARQESLPTMADPKGCCTKYVECSIIPSKANPAGALWDHGDVPVINQNGYFTTDWYSGACVACYHDGKWRDLR